MRDRKKEKELREQLIRVEEQRNYWMEQYSWNLNEMTSIIQTNRELKVDIQKLKKELREKEEQISELKDEIDIQKSKAAKYLSCYLEEMEKHAPND